MIKLCLHLNSFFVLTFLLQILFTSTTNDKKLFTYPLTINFHLNPPIAKSISVSIHDYLHQIIPTFEFCVSEPKQCFPIALDNTIYQTWIPSNELSQYFNNTYTKTINEIETHSDGSTALLDNAFVSGYFAKTKVSPYKNDPNGNEPLFLIAYMKEGTIHRKIPFYSGKMGLLKFSPHLEDNTNYLYFLKANGLIDKQVFAIEIKDFKQGNIVIGEDTEKYNSNNVGYCEMPKNHYQLSWTCKLSHIIYGNMTLEITSEKGEFVMIETLRQTIQAPIDNGEYILQQIVKKSNDMCSIIKEGRIMYLTCDEKYNIEKIDNILLKSGNFELKLFANDFFEFSGEQNKYISKLVVDMNEKEVWNVGVVGMNNKMIIFDKEDDKIGIIELKRKKIKKINLFWICFGIGFIIIVIIIFLSLFIRRSRLRKSAAKIDFTLMKK